ncbi:PqqD family protein [bacterium]|nr:PqqD family protein [bacterium]MBU1073306.1 PqqD family protein [bacterium]MBU1676972.1 PqqD family protein [bacterium]
MFGFKKTPKPDRWKGRNVLELVPVQLVAHEASGTDGLVRLLEPRFRDRLLGRILQPRLPRERAHVKVELDARGSDIWRAIDGRTSVAELVGLFVARHPDDSQQAPERVWRFLAVMEHHGFIELEPTTEA